MNIEVGSLDYLDNTFLESIRPAFWNAYQADQQWHPSLDEGKVEGNMTILIRRCGDEVIQQLCFTKYPCRLLGIQVPLDF
jgi:hypothetical protein